jgi:hypothetical protein
MARLPQAQFIWRFYNYLMKPVLLIFATTTIYNYPLILLPTIICYYQSLQSATTVIPTTEKCLRT